MIGENRVRYRELRRQNALLALLELVCSSHFSRTFLKLPTWIPDPQSPMGTFIKQD